MKQESFVNPKGNVDPGKKTKPWERPKVSVLIIERDTFSGSVPGVEVAGKSGPPAKR